MGVKRTQSSGKRDSLGREIKVSGNVAERARDEMDPSLSGVPLGDFSEGSSEIATLSESDVDRIAETVNMDHFTDMTWASGHERAHAIEESIEEDYTRILSDALKFYLEDNPDPSDEELENILDNREVFEYVEDGLSLMWGRSERAAVADFIAGSDAPISFIVEGANRGGYKVDYQDVESSLATSLYYELVDGSPYPKSMDELKAIDEGSDGDVEYAKIKSGDGDDVWETQRFAAQEAAASLLRYNPQLLEGYEDDPDMISEMYNEEYHSAIAECINQMGQKELYESCTNLRLVDGRDSEMDVTRVDKDGNETMSSEDTFQDLAKAAYAVESRKAMHRCVSSMAEDLIDRRNAR